MEYCYGPEVAGRTEDGGRIVRRLAECRNQAWHSIPSLEERERSDRRVVSLQLTRCSLRRSSRHVRLGRDDVRHNAA